MSTEKKRIEQEFVEKESDLAPDVSQNETVNEGWDPWAGVQETSSTEFFTDTDMETYDEQFEFELDEKPLLEPGIYLGQVEDVVTETARGSGEPMLTWTWKIRWPFEADGISIRYWTSLSPRARWKLAEVVRALGVPAAGGLVKFKRSEVINKWAKLVVTVEPYQDRDTSKVSQVLPVSEEDKVVIKQLDKLPR